MDLTMALKRRQLKIRSWCYSVFYLHYLLTFKTITAESQDYHLPAIAADGPIPAGPSPSQDHHLQGPCRFKSDSDSIRTSLTEPR
jgi:hypothetical protein